MPILVREMDTPPATDRTVPAGGDSPLSAPPSDSTAAPHGSAAAGSPGEGSVPRGSSGRGRGQRRRGPRRPGGAATPVRPAERELRERVAALSVLDRYRLGRRLDQVRGTADAAQLDRVAEQVTAGEQRIANRRAAVPAVTYPPELPVSEHREQIAAAIRDHQVVIVAGETGSGKTTQIPKICLELGRGIHGTIGHTQPRRIAARTVAERIAEELATPLGGAVGYQVRFTDQVGPNTLVKLMTDGILLAEIQRDRMLRRYDTIIIDEAHERSLNIDFLLGYLKRLLPRRPDLKVIITSATIETERFARHFGTADEPAPVIEVSGRTYPVEVRYRPITADDPDRDQVSAIGAAVDELRAEGGGDILVFLSGEREIRDAADALAKREQQRGSRPGSETLEILPLYARLSSAEQHRVFQPHRGRRVVLATNVAETSLTVPGIRYVIDTGTARISRYSHRLKVQRLPIEPVSQASANQRMGRCGRTSDGICIRLYDSDDFLSRPEYTDPEILRTNLASVLLQMAAARLGDIADFPFIDPPDSRQVRAGVQLLEELSALDAAGELTKLGRRIAELPIDPRLARMILEADANDCVREILVITAALSIQDPRERPADAQQQASQAHARFVDKESDFLAYLRLWKYLRDKQKELSGNQFRKLCRSEYLNYLRVREWQDLHSQLRQVIRGMGINRNTLDAPADRVHTALLSGLLSHIGLKDTERKKQQKARGSVEYLGARGAKFAIFPGSALARKQPQFVMAAELVETSRLWARVVAGIDPSTVEALAAHLVKRTYSEPHWEKRQAAVVGYEKVTLYGVPIVPRRKVNYGRIDPEIARDLFIRHALVDGDWETHHQFFSDNQRLRSDVEDLENRSRRRDIVVDDDTLYEFYDARIPAEVVSGRHFDAWWKKTRREQPELLTFTPDMLVTDAAGAVSPEQYPDEWHSDGLRLPLSYAFEPGTADDGVTVHVPLAVLGQVRGEQLDWQVPGLREELVTALLKGLPKQLRRNLVPVPDTARALLARISPADGPLLTAIERGLRDLLGVHVPRDAWQLDALPAHLRPHYVVEDGAGDPIATGRDLGALKDQLAEQARTALTASVRGIERSGLTDWTIGELPQLYEQSVGGQHVRAYPTLHDDGDSVSVRLAESVAAQRDQMWRGTRRLILLSIPSPAKYVLANLSNTSKLALSTNPDGSVPALLADCTDCAADKLIADAGGPAYDEEGFGRLRDAVRAHLNPMVLGALTAVEKILAAHRRVLARVSNTNNVLLVAALADIKQQLAGLVHAGFVAETGWQRLADLPRYLSAVDKRLDRLPAKPQRDREQMTRVRELAAEYEDARAQRPPSAELTAIRWMLEELRVSYFAQSLGTPYPISDRRIERALDAL
ncbi:ATP-dependent RNA helicase HrpA [Actinocatenispora sera]|uniref:RNA helicase n=1 Tax=Actinocatenispora sera TaxID=390989 RepID=A0A810L2X6_9ACTN|nr:ATP-dependent RNA helicase HrpA [Actinocatenispora sera]BCJ29255.1 ATP-dependent helicase [Actinocatenispora sera]